MCGMNEIFLPRQWPHSFWSPRHLQHDWSEINLPNCAFPPGFLNSPLPQAVRTKTGILAPPQPSLHSPEGVTACSLSPHLLSPPLPASGWDLPASHFDMDSLYWLLQFLSLLLVHLRDQCKIKLPESSFDPVSSTPYLDFQNKVQVPWVNTKSPS